MGSWSFGANQITSAMGPFKHLTIVAALAITVVYAAPEERGKKAIGIFNIVKFPNDACVSSTASRNGTCYTSEECSERSGVSSGSCADGYGVCCIIVATCGSTTSDNCTYLIQASSTAPSTDDGSTSGCSYKICPRSTDITRIRLDMTSFTISGPVTNTEATGTGITQTDASSIGACAEDSFTVSGGTRNVPVICGSNDGQHMIVDTDGSGCVTAMFNYGSATTARAYTIHVIQYSSSNEMGGPPGCLQFYTGTTGTVKTFNYVTATEATSTHLQNQDYNVCVRALADMCSLCWLPSTVGTSATPTRGSFALSNGGSTSAANGAAAGVLSGSGAACADDYVIIPQGVTTAAIANAATIPVRANGERFCGRRFNPSVTGVKPDVSICSSSKPFKMTVVTDGGEVATTAAAVQTGATNEGSISAANAADNRGTLGFSLTFTQNACT